MNKCIIQVKNASFCYGNKKIFKDINLEINQGEVFCVLGPNGCGKTTLLSCILGSLELKEGNIFINGIEIKNIKPKDLAKSIAYVPQIHERTFPYKVKEIVLMGRAHQTTIFSAPTKLDMEIALESLDKVGILDLAEEPYTQLSGGQCQLVMIARALAQKPKIIVMDEPTSHLDFKNELLILETVADLVKNENLSILMATHFPNHTYYFESKKINTAVALMDNGILREYGCPDDIITEDNVLKTYQIDSKIINMKLNEECEIKQIIPLSINKNFLEVSYEAKN